VRAIVFCSSIEHARHVAAEFNEAGYKFDLLVGAPEMSDAERTSVNKRLRSGDLHGACTVDLVSEGYDLPDLECCIMLRPTASEALFLQQAGRVMRPSDGKTNCYLLDHVGNVGALIDGGFKRKHGLPNEVREWTLDGRKKKKKGPKDPDEVTIELKQCPKCYVVSAPSDTCPACGFEYPASGRSLEHVEGELHQVTEAMQAKIKLEQRSAQSAAKSVEDMMQQLGYSRGRAEAIVKARAEKAELSTGLLFDLRDWRAKTGQDIETLFGLKYLSDLKQYKPKALRELREKFDAHRSEYTHTRVDVLRGDLFPTQRGDEAAF
jgi:superfamily II DNA or RNA helicase